MKKEYYWFLIFILAAAVVTGTTLGVLTNLKYISQQSKILLQDNEAVEATPIALDNASQQTGTANNNDPISANSPTQIAISGSTDTKVMFVSPTEKNEIEAMLNTVEGNTSKDYNDRITIFQEKHALPATGILDVQTLSILINQATIQKSVQHLNN